MARLSLASRFAKATIRLVGGVGRPDAGSGQPSCLRSLICCREAFFTLRGRRLLGVAASVVAAACAPERLLRPTLHQLSRIVNPQRALPQPPMDRGRRKHIGWRVWQLSIAGHRLIGPDSLKPRAASSRTGIGIHLAMAYTMGKSRSVLSVG